MSQHVLQQVDRSPEGFPEADGAAELAPWFHNVHFPDGTQSAPRHPLGDFPNVKWCQIAGHVPEELEGWRALDIGSNAGFYSFELARRGARVVGIEPDPHYLAQARWCARRMDPENPPEFRQGSVYDLAHLEERFDLVLFMGVFYHLRYPLLALDVVAEKVDRLLVFQSLTMPGRAPAIVPDDLALHRRLAMLQPGWPKMAFIEHQLAGDPTNWWAPNVPACRAMLRSAGLEVVAEPGHELFVCRPGRESGYQREQRRQAVRRATGGSDERIPGTS